MTKAKKRVAARKKSPKRGKASAEPTRKLAAKHAKPKKAMSKVQRAGMSAKKPSAKQKRPADIAERRQVAEIVETKTTIMDVIEEPAGGVVAVTEYASVRTTASIPPGAEPGRGEAIGPNSPELKPRDAGRS
jgi:hypothetical protein